MKRLTASVNDLIPEARKAIRIALRHLRRRMKPAGLLLLLGLAGASVMLAAPGTAFTYQGRLRDTGTPATGVYDLRFTIHDSASGGSQIGPTVTSDDMTLTNGLFNVTLDFGDGVFTGADRWLEIGLRPGAETGAYATLSPRRLLASVPYAVQAANATTAASANAVAAANVTGSLALGQLPAAVVTNNASAVTLAGSFTGNAAGLTNLDAGDLTGTVSDARLSANVALLSSNQVFTGSNRFAGVVTLTNVASTFAGGFTGNAAGLTNLDAGDLTGTVSDARLSANVALLSSNQVFTGSNRFAGVVTLTNVANTFAGGFTGNAAGLTNLDAGDLTGTVSDARLSANVALLSSNQVFTGSNRFTGVVTLTNVASTFAGAFTGNAAGLTNLDAGDLTGTVSDARLSANVAKLNAGQTFTGANTFNNAANNFTGSGAGLTGVNADQLDGQHGAFYQNAANLNAGTLPDARLSGTYSAALTLNNAANSFAGNGAGLTSLNGINIASGTITTNQLAANSVDSGKIVDGSVTAADLSSDAAALTMVSGGAMDSELGGISIGTTNLPGGPFQVFGDTATVDQKQDSYNSGVNFSTPLWQSFTAGTNGTLTAVELNLGSAGSVTPWSATLRIWDGEGSGGTTLSTQTIHGDGNGTPRIFPLATPVSVVAGQKYTIGITPLGVRLHWRDRSGNPYAGGQESFDAAYDLWFRTFLAAASSQPALVVQPATLNVGIGTTTPGFPLTFANVLGDKISLWGQSGAHYGFGIQGSLLQIYSGASSADIAFGYGESTNFTERVRFKGSGNVGIGTNAPTQPLHMGSGAYCSVAGVWTSVSDRNVKERFTAINAREVLERLAALPITEWKYQVEPEGVKHVGPVAQDFHAAFGLGDNDKAIGTVDEAGVALAAIQGLNQKLEQVAKEKDARITELEQSVAKLQALVKQLVEQANESAR